MTIKTEIEIKNDLLPKFSNLEIILENMTRNIRKKAIAEEYYNVNIKIMEMYLKIPTYTNQNIISEYELKFLNERNETVAKYKGREILIWIDSPYQTEEYLEPYTGYLLLYSPKDELNSQLKDIARSARELVNYISSNIPKNTKRAFICIKAKLYIDKNPISSIIGFIKKNQEKNQEIIDGIVYYNGKTKITVSLKCEDNK